MRKAFAILVVLLVYFNANAQEYPIIGQYLFNEMLLNPASTGHSDAFDAQVSYRKQWLSVDGAPSTQNFSVQTPLLSENIGVGLTFYRDQIGVSSEAGVMGNFAYRIRIKNDQRLIFGVGAGLFFQRVRFSQLQVTHSSDQSFIVDSPLGMQPNFSAGIRYEVDGLELGFSVPMLLTTNFNSNTKKFQLQHRFSNYTYLFRTVYNYQLNNDFAMKFGGLYKYHPIMKSQMDFTIMAEIKKKVGLGIGYRSDEGVLVLSRIKITEQFDFGAQYEIPTAKMYQYKAGSVEISLIYTSLFKSKAESPRTL